MRVSPEGRSRIMRGVHSRDTSIEIMVRKALFRAGFRYRLHREDLPGKPDLVFSSLRKAIFVNGCFWHQHPNCPRAKLPRTNRKYWLPKLKQNRKRDQRVLIELSALGWKTHIIWECALEDFDTTIARAVAFLRNT